MLNICKKIKIYKKSVTIVKLADENLNKKNNFNKKNFKNNIFKIIKLFFNKKPSSNSLNNKKLKLPFSPFLHYL